MIEEKAKISKRTYEFNSDSYKKNLIFIVSYYLFLVLGFGYLILSQMIDNNELIFNIIIFGVMLAIGITLFCKSLKSNVFSFPSDFSKHSTCFFVTPIVTLIVYIISIIVVSLNFIEENANEEALDPLFNENKFLFFILAVILGTVVEELVFRKCIFGLLRRKTFILAHIITAFLFGANHVWDVVIIEQDFSQLYNIIPYALLSLGLTFSYEKSKNILFPISIHMFINSIAFYGMLQSV